MEEGDSPPKQALFSHDAELLRLSADASAAVYDGVDIVLPSHCTLLEKHADYVIFKVEDKGVVVAFRGTKPTNRADVAYDFLQAKVERVGDAGEPFSICGGYAARAKMHGNVVARASVVADAENLTLVVTGHSLGAAESNVQTFEAMETDAHTQSLLHRNKLVNLTIASPNVGDSRYAAYLQKKGYDKVFFHVVHVGDPVVTYSKRLHEAGPVVDAARSVAMFATGNTLGGLLFEVSRRNKTYHGSSLFGTYIVLDDAPADAVTGCFAPSPATQLREVPAGDLDAAIKGRRSGTSLGNHSVVGLQRNFKAFVGGTDLAFQLQHVEDYVDELKARVSDGVNDGRAVDANTVIVNSSGRRLLTMTEATALMTELKQRLQVQRQRQRHEWQRSWAATMDNSSLTAEERAQFLATPFCQGDICTAGASVSDAVALMDLQRRLRSATAAERQKAMGELEGSVRRLLASGSLDTAPSRTPASKVTGDAAAAPVEDDSDDDSADGGSGGGRLPPRPADAGGPTRSPDSAAATSAPANAAFASPLAALKALKTSLEEAARQHPGTTISRANARSLLSPEGAQAMDALGADEVQRVFELVHVLHPHVSTASTAPTTGVPPLLRSSFLRSRRHDQAECGGDSSAGTAAAVGEPPNEDAWQWSHRTAHASSSLLQKMQASHQMTGARMDSGGVVSAPRACLRDDDLLRCPALPEARLFAAAPSHEGADAALLHDVVERQRLRDPLLFDRERRYTTAARSPAHVAAVSAVVEPVTVTAPLIVDTTDFVCEPLAVRQETVSVETVRLTVPVVEKTVVATRDVDLVRAKAAHVERAPAVERGGGNNRIINGSDDNSSSFVETLTNVFANFTNPLRQRRRDLAYS